MVELGMEAAEEGEEGEVVDLYREGGPEEGVAGEGGAQGTEVGHGRHLAAEQAFHGFFTPTLEALLRRKKIDEHRYYVRTWEGRERKGERR